jgi:hypothetical protein
MQHSMTILGELQLPSGIRSNNPNDRVYAYVNNNCVGMANPMEAANGLIFLSVGENSDEAAEVSFRIWLDDAQELYQANETTGFEPLKGEGELQLPFKFTLGEVITDNSSWLVGEPYPNPFDNASILPVTLNKEADLMLKLYNSTGQIVWQKLYAKAEKGEHEYAIQKGGLRKGVYALSIEISAGNELKTERKILIIH